MGRTWSQPRRTELPNNNSGIQLARLRSGALALVFNNNGLENGARYPMSVALSYNDGLTWPFVRDLELNDGG